MARYPVLDLAGYLDGVWSLTRRVRDIRAGNHARFVGVVTFSAQAKAEGPVLSCRELGEITMAHYRGPAHRDLKLTLTSARRGQFQFADGRPFVALDLSSGQCDLLHSCEPDLYVGRAWARDRRTFWMSWRVHGPRKDMLIAGRYKRSISQRTRGFKA